MDLALQGIMEVFNDFKPPIGAIEIDKSVECELSENALENFELCNAAGFMNGGDFGADRFDMKLTKLKSNVEVDTIIVDHTQFIQEPNPEVDHVEAEAEVEIDQGFKYKLSELRAVALNGTEYPVDTENLPIGCIAEPGFTLVGSIDLQEQVICVIISEQCASGVPIIEKPIPEIPKFPHKYGPDIWIWIWTRIWIWIWTSTSTGRSI